MGKTEENRQERCLVLKYPYGPCKYIGDQDIMSGGWKFQGKGQGIFIN